MESARFAGVVRHRRLAPRRHRLAYPLFMLSADLDELDGLFAGGLGAAGAHRDGLWEGGDLVALVRLFARNRDALEGIDSGLARPGAAPARHLLRGKSRRSSQRNIEAHYDLGSDFFRLFLDPSMTYSSALFERREARLEEARRPKTDRLCRRLRLGPQDHLLEIGTGWGALAIHSAREYGCRVTTTTISPAQRDQARA